MFWWSSLQNVGSLSLDWGVSLMRQHPPSIHPAFTQHPPIIHPLSTQHPTSMQPASTQHSHSIHPLSTQHPPSIHPASTHYPPSIQPASNQHQPSIHPGIKMGDLWCTDGFCVWIDTNIPQIQPQFNFAAITLELSYKTAWKNKALTLNKIQN